MNHTEKHMRQAYKRAFGQEYDDPRRKLEPLPLYIAYQVAIRHKPIKRC